MGGAAPEVSFRQFRLFGCDLESTGESDTHAGRQLADPPEEANHVRPLEHVACVPVPSHA